MPVSFKGVISLRGGCEEVEEEKPAEEPKGFDLDAWKRLYSNAPSTETILPEFWAKFDKEVIQQPPELERFNICVCCFT